MRISGDGFIVRTLDELIALADQGRSVTFYHCGLGRTMPAAFVQNWQGRMIHNAISRGMLANPKKGGR